MGSTTIRHFGEHCWTEILKKLAKAIVFIDDASAESLHWHGGLQRLMKAGVIEVRELSSFEFLNNHKKASFIVSGPVVDLKADIIGEIIRGSKFEYCQIFTNAAPSVHNFARFPGRTNLEELHTFNELENTVLEWMGNFNYTCEIFYVPFHTAALCNEAFVMPAFSHLFPLLDPDLSNELVKWRERHPESPGSAPSNQTVGYEHFSHELKVSIQHFVTAIHSILQAMNLGEDIFTVGSFSSIIGDQLECLPAARQRRKLSQQKTSVIFVDRTLDLTEATSCDFATLLDRIRETLPSFPGHANDVQVEMGPLFGLHDGVTSKGAFPPGCLAQSHYLVEKRKSNNEDSIFSAMIMKEEKDAIADIKRALMFLVEDECTFDSDDESEEKADDVTALSNLLTEFKEHEGIIQKNLDLLQRASAVTEVHLRHSEAISTLRRLQTECLRSQTTDLGRGHLVSIVQLIRNRRESGLTLDHILLLLIFVYSLSTHADGFYPEDEDRLQSVLSEALVKDKKTLGPVIEALAEGREVDDIVAHKMVKAIFQRLQSIPSVRSKLKSDFDHWASAGSHVRPVSYLHQLLMALFAEDRRDVADVQHKTGGLGNLLLSGFSRLGVSVAKMHPRENQRIFIFLLGGSTGKECKLIRELVASRSKCELMLGSTRLISPKDTLSMLFANH